MWIMTLFTLIITRIIGHPGKIRAAQEKIIGFKWPN